MTTNRNRYYKNRYSRLKEEGKCVRCRHDRGDNGTKIHCRSCAEKQAKYDRRRGKRLKAQGLCLSCGQRKIVGRHRCILCRQKTILNGAKYRAKRDGVSFDLTVEDIEWNRICPVLGISLDHKSKNTTPSLDRLIPEKGYVKGNVHIISYRANRLKSDATIEEVRKLLDWMKEQD